VHNENNRRNIFIYPDHLPTRSTPLNSMNVKHVASHMIDAIPQTSSNAFRKKKFLPNSYLGLFSYIFCIAFLFSKCEYMFILNKKIHDEPNV